MPEPISHEQGIILPDQSVQRGTLDLPADILPNGVTQDNFTTEGGLVVPSSRGGVLKAVHNKKIISWRFLTIKVFWNMGLTHLKY